MEHEELAFAELLCAKLCTFMGDGMLAINSGVSFLASSAIETQARSFEFVSIKTKEAMNKLAFLRQAYGLVHQGFEASIEVVDAGIKDFLSGTNVSCDLMQFTDSSLDVQLAKLIYNLVITISEFMLYAGDLNILIDKKLVLIGSYAKSDEGVDWGTLIGKKKDKAVTIHNIQHVYTKALADRLNYTVQCKQTLNGIKIVLSS
jgi:hypothetical protein